VERGGRTRIAGRTIRLLALETLALAVSLSAPGQAPVITSFSQNGVLVCSNLYPGSTATVQQASSLIGTWSNLVAMTAGSNQSIVAEVPVIVAGAPMFYRVLGVAVPAGMAVIPAGDFTMGDNLDGTSDALPLHTVYVSAFYMDRYEVTKALWDDVYSWAVAHGYSFEYGAVGKANNHPTQTVTWFESAKWCNARSEKEGKVPAYYTDAGLSVRYRSGWVAPYVSWSSGYRLPTEAEWEKAARSGASGQRFPWGDTISWSQANYNANPSGYPYDVNPTSGYNPAWTSGGTPYTTAVGSFGANAYGLYDMAGNVSEWCWDWYGSYSSAAQNDPRGPTGGTSRVHRGGGWADRAPGCRTAAYRSYRAANSRFNFIGFRCVLSAAQ